MARALPRRALAAFLAVWLLTAPGVAAHDDLDWPPSTYSIYKSTTTWRTAGDSLYASTSVTWNSADTSAMRHMEGHGYRFTHDVHDRNNNLNATGRYSTQLPNPYYDRDPTGGPLRHDEGEITVESTTFPTANQYYQSHIEFSHWYYTTGSMGTVWYWDSGSGSLAQAGQISERGCAICDKWDAADGLNDLQMGDTPYPSKSAPSGAALAEPGPIVGEGAVTRASVAATLDTPFCAKKDKSGQVTIVPSLDKGLRDYRTRAKAVAEEVAAGGPSRGVLTFSRPVSVGDLAELQAAGLVIESVEAVTTNEHGPRWTIGAPADDLLASWLDGAVTETGESLLGIVSAQVLVDADSLAATQADDRVYLVDLSIEQYGRRNQDAKDVVMNDVYWSLAGWAD